MARYTPTVREAAGMLSAIKKGHSADFHAKACLRGCTWDTLDVEVEGDRRIIASVYAADARRAMGA